MSEKNNIKKPGLLTNLKDWKISYGLEGEAIDAYTDELTKRTLILMLVSTGIGYAVSYWHWVILR